MQHNFEDVITDDNAIFIYETYPDNYPKYVITKHVNGYYMTYWSWKWNSFNYRLKYLGGGAIDINRIDKRKKHPLKAIRDYINGELLSKDEFYNNICRVKVGTIK